MKPITIRHKKDGTPYARPYMGRSVDGKPLRPYREFPNMTDAEAQAAAAAWLEEWSAEHTRVNRETLRQALDGYVGQMEARGRSYNTIRSYRQYTRHYLLDLAGKPVADVTAQDLDDLFVTLLTEGASGAAPLSAMTVQTFRAFLQGAWKTFVRYGMASSNVVRETMKIQAPRRESQALDAEETKRLISAIRRDLDSYPTRDEPQAIKRRNYALAILIALYTGARVGEVAALRRRDVRLWPSHCLTISGNVVEVEGKTVRQDKTKGKRTRTLTIDAELAAELSRHIAWQDGYMEGTDKDTPICTTHGEHMRPSRLSEGFTLYRRELNLDAATTFHSLRHTHATTLLLQGITARVVQERMGHANVTTTLNIYGHVMPTNDAEAAAAFSSSVAG